jgi:hypothetical protein
MQSEWIEGNNSMMYRRLIDLENYSLLEVYQKYATTTPNFDYSVYHDLQVHVLICSKGCVEAVYENQGPPIVMRPGDVILEPPCIRHSVLYSSDELSLLDFSSPGKRNTYVDFQTILPSTSFNPHKKYFGQQFLHFSKSNIYWATSLKSWCSGRWQFCNTEIDNASSNAVDVTYYRPNQSIVTSVLGDNKYFKHGADILYVYVLSGYVDIFIDNNRSHKYSEGSTVVLPSSTPISFARCSMDLEFIAVSIPGKYSLTPCDNPFLVKPSQLQHASDETSDRESLSISQIQTLNESDKIKILSTFIDDLENGIAVMLHRSDMTPKQKTMILLNNKLRWYSADRVLQWNSIKVSPSDLVRVDVGKVASGFQTEYCDKVPEDHCFSLCTDYTSLDMEVPSKDIRDGYVLAFRLLIVRLKTSLTIAI